MADHTTATTAEASIMADLFPLQDQLATELPKPTIFVTGHRGDGKAVVHSQRAAAWRTVGGGGGGGGDDDDNTQSHHMQMAVAWTTAAFPADLTDDRDVAAHDARMAAGPMPRLVAPGGTVLRYVDFAPGYECLMHRTVSVDYGVVLEGEVLSKLDSGAETLLRRGDVMVQRATMHAWKNPSPTHWARMLFCLQECRPPRVAGQVLGEDLTGGARL